MGKLSSAERVALIVCATMVVLSVVAGVVLIAVRIDGQISQEVVAGMLGVISTGVTAALALIMHSNSTSSAAQMAAAIMANLASPTANVPVTVTPVTPSSSSAAGASASV